MEAEKLSKPDLTAYFEQVFAKKFNAIQSMEGDEEAMEAPRCSSPHPEERSWFVLQHSLLGRDRINRDAEKVRLP